MSRHSVLAKELEKEWCSYYKAKSLDKLCPYKYYLLQSLQYDIDKDLTLLYCGEPLRLSYKIPAIEIQEDMLRSPIDWFMDKIQDVDLPHRLNNTIRLVIKDNKKVAGCLYSWRKRDTMKSLLLPDGRLLDHCEIQDLYTVDKITYITIKYFRTFNIGFATWWGVANLHKHKGNIFVTESIYGGY